ncbi:MAG: S41 family peptidase [Acidobacteriota bacterium]|nr:S41 family peptidase [Acidobacteriota bacterium]
MIVFKLIAVVTLAVGYVIASPHPIDGIWRSDGWGFVYKISVADLQAFEITSTTCVLGVKATRLSREAPGHEASFRARNGDMLYIVAGGDDDHKRIERPAGLTSIVLSRLSALPDVCTPPTANTPLGNFDVFAQTFAEHYISFDLRHIDWDRIVTQQRKRITPRTTPTQLFEILKAMLEPLTDIHTGLEAPKIKRNFDAPLRPGTDRVVGSNIDRFAKAGRRELAAITNHAYFHGLLLSFCRGQWQYGLTESGVGYLRILQFGDYSRESGFEHDLRALNRALDRILGNPKLRGLVIDVRLSFGGDDRLGLAIAARLTTRDYMTYSIQARSDPVIRSSYTPLQPVMVRPGYQPIFGGPAVELTGPITMSAAETFTQALMGRTPCVTRIGENTQGVFCDVLDRHLPNGWSFGLPNAVYRTPTAGRLMSRVFRLTSLYRSSQTMTLLPVAIQQCPRLCSCSQQDRI